MEQPLDAGVGPVGAVVVVVVARAMAQLVVVARAMAQLVVVVARAWAMTRHRHLAKTVMLVRMPLTIYRFQRHRHLVDPPMRRTIASGYRQPLGERNTPFCAPASTSASTSWKRMDIMLAPG